MPIDRGPQRKEIETHIENLRVLRKALGKDSPAGQALSLEIAASFDMLSASHQEAETRLRATLRALFLEDPETKDVLVCMIQDHISVTGGTKSVTLVYQGALALIKDILT